MKQKNIALVIILSLVVIYLLMFLFARFYMNADNGVYMFESIEECYKISELDYKNKNVTVYEAPDLDKNAEGLSYTSFYGAKFESDGLNFQIFAYEFESESDAGAYFKNVATYSPSADPCYLVSGNLLFGEIVVINGKNAYSVQTLFLGELEFSKAIEDVFTIRIK